MNAEIANVATIASQIASVSKHRPSLFVFPDDSVVDSVRYAEDCAEERDLDSRDAVVFRDLSAAGVFDTVWGDYMVLSDLILNADHYVKLVSAQPSAVRSGCYTIHNPAGEAVGLVSAKMVSDFVIDRHMIGKNDVTYVADEMHGIAGYFLMRTGFDASSKQYAPANCVPLDEIKPNTVARVLTSNGRETCYILSMAMDPSSIAGTAKLIVADMDYGLREGELQIIDATRIVEIVK